MEGSDDLGKIRGQQAAVADQGDAAGAAAYDALAKQLGAVSPEAAGMVLDVLPAALGAIGAKLEGDLTTLGDPQVGRALSALADLTEDAAEAGVIGDDMVIRLEAIADDTGAQMLAGQLSALAESKGFSRWAKTPAQQAEKPVAKEKEPAKAEAAPDDDFLMSRMGKAKPAIPSH